MENVGFILTLVIAVLLFRPEGLIARRQEQAR